MAYLLLNLMLAFTAHSAVLDEQKGCGQARTPAQLAEGYCRMFALNPALASDEAARRAKAACLPFYQNAAEAMNLVCSYRVEATLQQARFETATAQSKSGQQELVENLATINQEAKNFHRQLLDRLEAKYNSAEATHKKFSESLTDLGGVAGKNSVNESACLPSPSRVPGAILSGLLLTAADDKKKTFDALLSVLNELGTHADNAMKEENTVAVTLSRAGGNLNTLMPGEKEEIQPAQKNSAGAEVDKPQALWLQLLGRSATSAANRNVVAPMARLVNPKAHWAATGIIGANVNLIFRLLNKGKLDTLDYASSGAALLSGAKATAGKALLVVSAAQTVEYTVRRFQYDTYLAKKHAEFSVTYLKQNPNASSEDLAKAFRENTQGKHCQGHKP